MEERRTQNLNPMALNQNCSLLPPKTVGPGQLHLKFRSGRIMNKLEVFLRNANYAFTEHQGALSIDIPHTDLAPLITLLMDGLLPSERAEVRALFQAQGVEMGLHDYFEVDSLQNFVIKEQNSWLLDMVRAHRLQSVFQPIVACHDRNKVFAYECLLRGRDRDSVIYPARIFDVARGSGLLFQVDFAARRTAITGAARFKMKEKIFINFTPMERGAAVHCLRSTLDMVDELQIPREQIVFEVIESELIHEVESFQKIIGFYRECGFGIALDDLGAGYASLNMLGQIRPDYVKLDRELTRDVHNDAYKALISRKLIETAKALGIQIVAEGIECEGEAEWLCEQGCDYAQGYYFAAPDSPPPLLQNHDG